LLTILSFFNYYEKIEETVSPVRKEMGVYLKQYAAFWLEQDGLQIGKIARLFNNSSVTSDEWTKTSKSDKITALIDVAHVASREDTT